MTKKASRTAAIKINSDNTIAKLATNLPLVETAAPVANFPEQTGKKIRPYLTAEIQDHDYLALGRAFAAINTECFAGRLTRPVITYAEKGAGGFKPNRFETATNNPNPEVYGELSINPDNLRGLSAECALLDLIHQMLHQHLYAIGESSGLDYKNDFHKAAYIKAAEEIGLTCVGKGRKVSLIVSDREGLAAKTMRQLLAKNWALRLVSIPLELKAANKTNNSVKLVCACGETCTVKRRDDGTFPQMYCGECSAIPQRMVDESVVKAKLEDSKDDLAELTQRAAAAAKATVRADLIRAEVAAAKAIADDNDNLFANVINA